MLNWLRGLMNGDQNSIPRDGRVTRDALGRIVKVEHTLSAPQADSALPILNIGPDLAALLPAACDWLAAQNQRLAARHGLGTETSFLFDQDNGTLTLSFEDGRRVVAQAQVLGSFDPADRSFLWGWANASIRPDLSRDIAGLRDRTPEPNPFATPRHAITFDTLTPLLGIACQRTGADGLYRCVGNGVSLFLAIRIASDAALQPSLDPALADEARAVVDAYDAEMLPFDRAYAAAGDGATDLEPLRAGKIAVYRRYWRSDDDYWEPSSLGWPSEHDPAAHRLRFVVPCGSAEALCVTIEEHATRTVYHLRRIDGALRIVDQLLDWGNGFVWPLDKAVPTVR